MKNRRRIAILAAAVAGMGAVFSCVIPRFILKEDSRARWAVKTSLPGASDAVREVPLAALLDLPDPTGIESDESQLCDQRIPPFANVLGLSEGDLVATTGWVHFVGRAWDGDYHMPLSASASQTEPTLITEVPEPTASNMEDPLLRKQCEAVRDKIDKELLNGHRASLLGHRVIPPRKVRVTGQLFYDVAYFGKPARGRAGDKAGSLWEVHPVTNIEFLDGTSGVAEDSR